MSPQLSVFIASSLDGYIATTDDSLDWLDAAAAHGEDYGFDDFIGSVDALAMGRGTYNYITHIDPLPFEDRPVYVFTHRPPPVRPGVTFWQPTPREALAHWTAQGHRRVYVDGGNLIASFLAEDLIDDLLITTAPVLLGSGRPLFPPIARTTELELVDVTVFPSGMVNRKYRRR